MEWSSSNLPSSELEISVSITAVFSCDGENVKVTFFLDHDQQFSDATVFTRAEAVDIGTKIAKDGCHKRIPIRGEQVKVFGERLKLYGLNGK